MKNSINPHIYLSKREQQILELVVLGYNSEQIGEMLYITLSTVNTHIRNIKSRTGAKKATDMSLIWFCRTQNLTIDELLRKRLLPVIFFIALQLFSTLNGNDIVRARTGRSGRSRRYETEQIII